MEAGSGAETACRGFGTDASGAAVAERATEQSGAEGARPCESSRAADCSTRRHQPAAVPAIGKQNLCFLHNSVYFLIAVHVHLLQELGLVLVELLQF